MASISEPRIRTQTDLFLGLRFEPTGVLTTEAVRLVMRDFRQWSRAAGWVLDEGYVWLVADDEGSRFIGAEGWVMSGVHNIRSIDDFLALARTEYYNLPLRLKVEQSQLEKELEQAREQPMREQLDKALVLVSEVDGEPVADGQETRELIRAIDGVVANTLQELDSDEQLSA